MGTYQSFSRRAKLLGVGAVFGLGLLGATASAAEARPRRHSSDYRYRRGVALDRYRTSPRFYRTSPRFDRGSNWRSGRYAIPSYRSGVGGYRYGYRDPFGYRYPRYGYGYGYRSPHPIWQDTDRDGIRNENDRDVDNDGFRNRFDRDDDNDGVRDRWDRSPRKSVIR